MRASTSLAHPLRSLVLAAALAGCGAGYVEQRPETGPDGYYPDGQPPPAYTPAAAQNADEYADTDPSAITDFYAVLAPYGTWVNDPNYGTVWVPDPQQVGADFAPYQTAGSWGYTDDGDYLWNSEYDWGYVPFHYGRWVYITARGWSWIPGRRYAPSWVVWRTSDYGYLGWAPMPPSYYWMDGYAYSLWASPSPAWVFCPSGYLFYPRIQGHIVRDRPTIERIAAHSRPHTPAQPQPGHAHTPAKPQPGHAHTPAQPQPGQPGNPVGGWERARPSLKELGVPDSAVPQHRARADANALALSTKSGTQSWREAGGGRAAPANPAMVEHGRPSRGGWDIGRGDAPVARPAAAPQPPPAMRLPPAGEAPVGRAPPAPAAPVRSMPAPARLPPAHAPPVHAPPAHAPRPSAPPAAAPPRPAAPVFRAPSGGNHGSSHGGGGSRGGGSSGGGRSSGGGGRRR